MIYVTKDKMAYGVTIMDDFFGHRSPTAHAQRHRFGRCNRTLFGRQYTKGGAGIEIICTNSVVNFVRIFVMIQKFKAFK
jgi:hypothetical protein